MEWSLKRQIRAEQRAVMRSEQLCEMKQISPIEHGVLRQNRAEQSRTEQNRIEQTQGRHSSRTHIKGQKCWQQQLSKVFLPGSVRFFFLHLFLVQTHGLVEGPPLHQQGAQKTATIFLSPSFMFCSCQRRHSQAFLSFKQMCTCSAKVSASS